MKADIVLVVLALLVLILMGRVISKLLFVLLKRVPREDGALMKDSNEYKHFLRFAIVSAIMCIIAFTIVISLMNGLGN